MKVDPDRIGSGPLEPASGPRSSRILRRVRNTSLEVIGFVVATALLPAIVLVAALVDTFHKLRSGRPFVTVRLVAALWWFLVGEMIAMGSLLWIWLRSGGPFGAGAHSRRTGIYRLRPWWTRHHLGGVARVFGLRFEVEGLELAAPGPVLIMIRHASIVDNMLPDSLIAHSHRLGLRYVVKQELEMIPVIDIGGRWLPTLFVRRASGETDVETAKMRRLAHDLGEDEGILIYPEGTRATPEKLARAKQKVAESQPENAELAARLQHLLPPRLSGPLALLDEASGVDVVFCAHVGFDGFRYISDILRGELVGTTIKVRFWRYGAAEVPAGERERVEWLYERWQMLDDWVDEQSAAA